MTAATVCLGSPGQLARVQRVMADGKWRTLFELSAATNDSQSSVSARLRDLRKSRFGGHTVERRRRSALGGTFEYRLVVVEPETQS